MTNELPQTIDFETISSCNRRCPTCLRNSHPNRKEVQSWFEPTYLPIELIKSALDQCYDLGFPKRVCLSHYNEPLMDERIVEIAKLVKSYKFNVFLNTNGDFMTEELAQGLDGVLDMIIVSLYMDEPIKSQRKKWIQSLFHKTKAEVLTVTDHIATHFSPKFDVKALAEKNRGHSCTESRIRIIINHRRQYLLCCEDLIGNFNLGTFPEIGIAEHWFGETRQNIMSNLRVEGGRSNYSYCLSCPRT